MWAWLSPGVKRAKQSQFGGVCGRVAEEIVQNKANLRRDAMNAKSPAGSWLGEIMTGCDVTKTKPIRRVEIATSACGLLAMTDGRRGATIRTARLGAVGQTCKTNPIWRRQDGVVCSGAVW
jgi:hypothetical protein